ncbi:hypothetical protein EX30DRAFT_162913 [Ascodesmis nigricans]|uniref:Uncharacterized protein n=1 Tax=Ascodesmis nigricans TaxID=341454 RepID=A0A4S2MS48_9PEZI|nr:hypothetical protein EX30DRAFT_162913 [Ascodesmis nigricans]
MSGGKVTQHFHGQNSTLSASNPPKESTVSEPGLSETPQKTWSQRKILTTYVSIRTTDKWAVSRGCIVEDRIYMYCNTHPSILEGSLLEFFVLDIADPLMTAMFEISEEQVIRNAFPPLPPPNDSVRHGMQPYYNIKSLDCLRDVLSSNETCRRDATSSWIRLAHDSFYRRLCCRDNKKLFHISLLSLVYELLDTIDSIDTIVPPPRPSIDNVWPELDHIIQVDDVGGTAIGAIEVSHRFQPNLLGGSRALRLKLRDMLIHIHGIVGARAAHRVQTVGIIVTGRQVQIVRCWARRPGGVVLLQPSDVQEFPERFQHIVALQYMVKYVIMGTQVLRDVSNVLMESQMGHREARFFEVDGVESGLE